MPRPIRRPSLTPARLILTVAFAGPLVLFACEEQQSTTATRTISDPAMIAAENRGRTTFPAFLRAFDAPEPGWGSFQVRYSYTTDNGFVDNIWLDLDSVGENSQLHCTVPADEDERAIRFEPGEKLVIEPGTVSDWMFIDADGNFVGGYTLRVTMDRIGNTSGDTDDDMHGGLRFRDLEDLKPDAPGPPPAP